jgi:hypothetical protein
MRELGSDHHGDCGPHLIKREGNKREKGENPAESALRSAVTPKGRAILRCATVNDMSEKMPADESIKTLTVMPMITAACRRLIHCSLRKATSSPLMLRK